MEKAFKPYTKDWRPTASGESTLEERQQVTVTITIQLTSARNLAGYFTPERMGRSRPRRHSAWTKLDEHFHNPGSLSEAVIALRQER